MSNRLEPPSAEPNRVRWLFLGMITILTSGIAYVAGVLVGVYTGYYNATPRTRRPWGFPVSESFSYLNDFHLTFLSCCGVFPLIVGGLAMVSSRRMLESKAKGENGSRPVVIVVVIAIGAFLFGCTGGAWMMLDLSRF